MRMYTVQDTEDARRDEEERARRSDQMRKDRAAVCLCLITISDLLPAYRWWRHQRRHIFV